MVNKVSVIIVSHNNKDILPRNLDSLRQQSFKDFDVYLMDNDSTDNTEKFIKKNYPEVKFFDISAGVDIKRNVAASKTSAEYLLTLDSDAVLSKDWMKKAVKYMDEHQDVGICCGKLINGEGKIDYAGSVFALNGGTQDIGHGEKDDGRFDNFKRIGAMTTACSIIRKKMFDKLKGFDENYYYGSEDSDIGLRANFAGWKVVYNPDLNAKHFYHQTTWKKRAQGYSPKKIKTIFYMRRNNLLILLQNFELKTLIINSPFICASMIQTFSKKHKKETLRGWIWIIRNFDKIKKRRKEIFKTKKISDKELFDLIYFPKIIRFKNYGKLKFFLKNSTSKKINNLTFFITTKCNSRCKHCFYWKSLNNQKDLSLKEIEKIISKFYDVNTVSLSGGEPFIRKDLKELIKIIVKYTNTKAIDIPTNCIRDVSSEFEEILKEFPKVTFSIDCSLDGLEEDHDHIRGVKGNFKKTIKMIYKFAELKKKYPNFVGLSVNTVIMNKNYKGLPKLINFVKTLPVDDHLFDIIRGDHQKILGPPQKREIKEINKMRYESRRFYSSKKSLIKKWFYNLKDKEFIRIQTKVLEGEKWPFRCSAGKNDLVIEADGKVRICELQPPIGNLFDSSPDELLKNFKSKEIFTRIKKHQCDCTHACNLSMSMNHSTKNLFSRILNYLKPL